MAALILPSRWAQQPQGAVEVDPGFGEFAFAVTPEIVPQCAGGLPALNGATVTAKSSGVAWSGFTNAGTERVDLPGNAKTRFFNSAGTLIVVAESSDWTAAQAPHLFSVRDGATLSIALLSTDDNASILRRIGIQIGASALSAPNDSLIEGAGKLNNIVFTWGAAGRRIFVNGDLVASDTVTGLPANNSIQPCFGNRSTGARGLSNGSISLGAGILRQVDDATGAELSVNPWQIFRPLSRRIYFDLGAGGGFTDSALSAAGAAAVALASQAIAKAALSSAGVASASPVGQAVATSALSAAGSATAAATGQALFSAVVTSAGVAAASFAGQSVSVSALASSGTATGAWTAKSLASSTVTAAGIASASFVALTSGFVDAVMSSAGIGAFAITAQSITQAVMSAAGTGAASWVGLVTGYADASFVMAGIAAASFAAQAIAQSAASSTATSTAAFGGQTLRQGAFSSAGSATSAWTGQSIAGAVLGAVGAGAAAFVGKAICQASAYAAGVGSVNWVHGNGPVAPALLRITGIRLMTAVSARSEIAPHVSACHRLN